MLSREVVIDARPLLAGEELRVVLSPYRGQCYVHVRRYYRDGAVMKPGKGASCRIDHLPWLLHTLRTAEAEALREGLLDEEAYESIGQAVPAELR